MNKWKKLLVGCVTGLAVLSLTGCGSTTIDLNKYITIEAEGYDTMGTLRYSFDYDQFEEDYDGKIKANVKSNDGGTASEIALELAFGATVPGTLLDYCVNYSVDKQTGLNNGDEISLTWDCEDEYAKRFYNCTLKYSDIDYTVKGLKEIPSFDPFDYVSLEFTPEGVATLRTDDDKEELQHIYFSMDRQTGLSNGDKLTVTAEIWENIDSFIDQFGAIPSPMEKEYTVTGIPRYATSYSEIDSSTFELMKKKAEDVFLESVAEENWKPDELEGFVYMGNCFLGRKEETGGDGNYLYIIYRVDAQFEGTKYPYYTYVMFRNILLDEEGNCSVDLDQYEFTSHWYAINYLYQYNHAYKAFYQLYNDCIQSKKDAYTCEENGLPKYVSQFADIDQAALAQMKQKTEEIFMESIAEEGWEPDDLQSLDYAGNYFLCKKEETGEAENYLYLVYLVTAQYEGEIYPYYTYVRFQDIIADDQGSCLVSLNDCEFASHMYMLETGNNWYAAWYNHAYETLDELNDQCIQPKTEKYTCEYNVSN